MKLTSVEKETIFLFNEHDTTVEIYTHNERLKRQLTELSEKHPDLYLLTSTDQYGGKSFRFAKKLMTVKFKEPLSAEKQAAVNARMAKMRSKSPMNQGVSASPKAEVGQE